MTIPDDLRYVKSHEWIRVGGDTATSGVTDFAQEELGGVGYVELPQEGDSVEPEVPFGVIESIKAVSDLFSGVTGEVVAVNAELPDRPETVNDDPYGAGWMIRVKLADPGELELLLNAPAYRQLLEEA